MPIYGSTLPHFVTENSADGFFEAYNRVSQVPDVSLVFLDPGRPLESHHSDSFILDSMLNTMSPSAIFLRFRSNT
jgi:hypothetical protein